MKNYKQLVVWQKGVELVKLVYLLTKELPQEEKFGIISQINRAAVSIPGNIAEGSSRDSDKDYCRFLQIALGSAFELQTYCILIKNLGWNPSKIDDTERLLEEIIKMLHSFIRQTKIQ
ncbi:four helix bundle protein [Prevotella sp. 10(H)]|uniref:four helix bundle protein n=1 Tax=Prevotella sp. 10(H) TaxID=1158294 RepID=UPI0004A6F856|nr:four helix bundle protein [Prevotella sp. 10(H)]